MTYVSWVLFYITVMHGKTILAVAITAVCGMAITAALSHRKRGALLYGVAKGHILYGNTITGVPYLTASRNAAEDMCDGVCERVVKVRVEIIK
jgi:hypothetical protein